MTIENVVERLERIEKSLVSQKNVLGLKEGALYTGISCSYLYKLTSTGQIPHYKPNGKMIYFSKVELDQWLLRNRVSTSDEINDMAVEYVIAKEGGEL